MPCGFTEKPEVFVCLLGTEVNWIFEQSQCTDFAFLLGA